MHKFLARAYTHVVEPPMTVPLLREGCCMLVRVLDKKRTTSLQGTKRHELLFQNLYGIHTGRCLVLHCDAKEMLD